jgi:hypothetical protein
MIGLEIFYEPSLKWILAEIFALGVLELIIYVPMFFRLTFRNFQFVHQTICSDIPGNPHVFNLLIISLFQTLPEPNNFNLVWTRVPIEKDVLVRGKIPFSRMSSWSVYGEGSDGVPNTIELCSNVDPVRRDFEVILTKTPEKYSKKSNILVIDTKGWKYGMCVMRNYLTPPGTEVYTPEIVSYENPQEVIRQPQLVVSGAATLHLDQAPFITRACGLFILHVIFWFLNLQTNLFTTSPDPNMANYDWYKVIYFNLIISIYGMATFLFLYHSLYWIAKKRLLSFVKEFCPQDNQLCLTSLRESAKASQPSKLHRYWIMKYSIPLNHELSVQGKISTSNQKYWSMVIYDRYGVPIPQFVYDLNVNRIPIKSAGNATAEEVYSYDIRMKNTGGQPAPPLSGSDATDIDVSKAAQGYVLFRLVHPVNDQAVEFSSPVTKLLESFANKQKKH